MFIAYSFVLKSVFLSLVAFTVRRRTQYNSKCLAGKYIITDNFRNMTAGRDLHQAHKH